MLWLPLMAAKKSSRKPKELYPPKGSYNMQDATYPGFHSRSLAKKSGGNPYVAQGARGSLTNVPARLSWPKGGGVSSTPRPAKSKSQVNALLNARINDIAIRSKFQPSGKQSPKVGDAKDRMGKSKTQRKK